jgi:hypothetical protein
VKLGPAFLLAASQAVCMAAFAQGAVEPKAAACPSGPEVTHKHLLGLWRAEFEGLAQGATLLLEQHPDLADSVRGAINRNGERAEVAGDVDDGEFTLEESTNGVNISATWTGTIEDSSCGTRIQGTWQSAGNPMPRAFVLRKQPDSR